MRTLIDTSVLIAIEKDRGVSIDDLPDESGISVMTLAELRMGVQTASSIEMRAARMHTLGFAERTFEALPVDEPVTDHYVRIMAAAKVAGFALGIHDGLIAATALRHDARLLAQDRDFAKIDGLDLILI